MNEGTSYNTPSGLTRGASPAVPEAPIERLLRFRFVVVVVFLGGLDPPVGHQLVPEGLGALAEGRVGVDHAVGGLGGILAPSEDSLWGDVAVGWGLAECRLGQDGGLQGRVRVNETLVCVVEERGFLLMSFM